MVSFIIPSYNEEQMILKTSSVLNEILQQENILYELIFVDDGSKDNTWQQIEMLSHKCKNIIGIHFSRNFGKDAAIFAGLANSKGDCCIVMDCDLQHPPQTAIQMYRLWEQGYEVVEGMKRSRGKETFLHTIFAKGFYHFISKATKMDMSKASDFKLLDRKVVKTLLTFPEKKAFFRALSSWVGYKTIRVEFDVQERESGVSKWSFWSLVKYAVTNITAFSTAAMQIVTIVGTGLFLVSILLAIQTLMNYLKGDAVEGFTTVILLLLMIGCIIMLSLGIIGYYIARIYEEVKGRPQYIISKMTDFSDKHLDEIRNI